MTVINNFVAMRVMVSMLLVCDGDPNHHVGSVVKLDVVFWCWCGYTGDDDLQRKKKRHLSGEKNLKSLKK